MADRIKTWPNEGKVDPTTGLPYLPEGYFWRVAPGVNRGTWHMKIMRRRRFLPDKQIDYTPCSKLLTESQIREEAAHLMRHNKQALIDDLNEQMLLEPNPLYGDYPIKSVSESGRMLGDFDGK